MTKRTCPQVSGIRCMTMKYIASPGIGAPQTLEQRNCTVIQACDPQFVYNRKYNNILQHSHSVDDHSNESYLAVLSCDTVYYAVQGGSRF